MLTKRAHHFRIGIGFLICALGLVSAAAADVAILGVQYRPDQPFPEHDCFWSHALPAPCPASVPMGASLHVFLRNTGTASVTVQDLTLAGQSMADVLRLHFQVVKRQPASIWLDDLTPEQLQALLDVGEPVWYKIDPATIPPGGTAQVVVRMRQTPSLPSVAIDVVHSGGTTPASVPVNPAQPRPVGVSFSPDLTKAYVYWHHPQAGAAPTTIVVDGVDLTANTTTVSDAGVNLAASVIQLPQALIAGSLHIFQGVYADGQTAGTAARAWNNPFIYGTWGAQDGASGDYGAARSWFDDATNHCCNALVVQGGSDAVKSYLQTAEGRAYAASLGYGFVIETIGQWSCSDPLLWFIRDEPDAADSRVTGIPPDKMVGSLAQMAVGTGEELRAAHPTSPTTINLDMTYKPFNWYNYGQVADVTMSDPYYQNRLREALWYYPERIPLYSKATFVYAVGQVAQSASEPNPLHIILYSNEYIDTTSGARFPFAPPATKRIEVYYALAAGAKGMSYWWYLPGKPANGLGARTPDALALWREIGLLGAEIRTAAPLLVTSTPANLNVQSSPGLWTRALLCGTDTIVLLAVNDQYYNDQQGCHYTPVANANLTIDLPNWMPSASAFEIASTSLRDVTTQSANGELQVDLGTVDVTRMIVVTANPQLRSTLQARFDQEVRPKVCAIAPELCQTTPSITLQPQPTSVCPDGSAIFTVAAIGAEPLAYRWQKDGADLADGGHYAGTGTDALTITHADLGDVGSYRCVVTNGAGSATSSAATLTVKALTVISQHPQAKTVGAGQTATFTVVAGGSGTLGYRWQKDEADLIEGGRYSGVATATLTISAVESGDAGNYRCMVTGDCGNPTSQAALLTVGPAPVPGDLDGDRDVDQVDFGLLQACLSGPLVPQTDPACEKARLDTDSDVDADDLAVYLRCYSGPNNIQEPTCAHSP